MSQFFSIYADTSFFVSVYVPDVHSPEAMRRLSDRPRLPLTGLHRAEWAHALFQNVFRGGLSERDAQYLQSEFERDRRAGVWLETDLPEKTFANCAELATRFVGRLGSRTLDSLHVALAIELGAESFWTFDERQGRLAAAVGLRIN